MINFFFVCSPQCRFSNQRQVACCFELLPLTAHSSTLLTLLWADSMQHLEHTFSLQRNVSAAFRSRQALTASNNHHVINLTFLWSLDFSYWYNRHHPLPTSQSLSDSIIQAAHCRGRRHPECNCQLFSLWIKPKETAGQGQHRQAFLLQQTDQSPYSGPEKKSIAATNVIALLIIFHPLVE